MTQLEATTDAGFEVVLEGFGFYSRYEREVIHQPPRAVLIRVDRVAAIVLREPTPQVRHGANVETFRILLAFVDVDVAHACE